MVACWTFPDVALGSYRIAPAKCHLRMYRPKYVRALLKSRT